MATEDKRILSDDESYASAEDADFAPDADIDAAEHSASESDSDAPADRRGAKRKAPPREHAADDEEGFENSGDEAIIQKGRKKRRKVISAAAVGASDQALRTDAGPGQGANAPAKVDDEEEDEDDRIVIKTRSMRAQEKAHRKTAKIASGPVTVDIDALWAHMSAQPVTRSLDSPERRRPASSSSAAAGPAAAAPLPSDTISAPPDTIRIKRTYTFAGKTHTEEKVVARDSAEARLWLASRPDGSDEQQQDKDKEQEPLVRKPRKAFRSRFEPRPAEPVAARTDLNLAMSARASGGAGAGAGEARKLNTVEKSRVDWAGFVDKEGIREELELAGRAKGSYNVREGFLARTEALREEEARKARAAGKAR